MASSSEQEMGAVRPILASDAAAVSATWHQQQASKNHHEQVSSNDGNSRPAAAISIGRPPLTAESTAGMLETSACQPTNLPHGSAMEASPQPANNNSGRSSVSHLTSALSHASNPDIVALFQASDARLCTSPKPPEDPQLDSRTVKELLHMMGSTPPERRFQAEEITQSLDLAEAARRELEQLNGGLKHRGLPGQQNEALELQRQQAAVDAVDADVEEESRVNCEVAELVVQRLEDGRRSLEGLVQLLQGLLAAESAYTAAMQGIARFMLDGPAASSSHKSSGGGSATTPPMHAPSPRRTGMQRETGDDPVQALVMSFAGLPETVGQAHRHLQGSLASLTNDCQRLHDGFCDACRRAAADAAATQAGVAAGRNALRDAFAQHADVCRSFNAILSERNYGRQRRGPDLDPWATEGRLAREHKALQQAQGQERAFLKRAFLQCQELESRRLELSRQAVAVAAGSYRAALLPVQHDLLGLMDSAQAVDTDTRLGKLAKAAKVAGEIAEKLSEQQAKSMEVVCQELFCSPEIIRQGEMQYLDAPFSRWTRGHFVLTRAGFLHWFRSDDQVEPLGMLNLAKCHFEAGTAFCFHVMETRQSAWLVSTRQRRFSFQAPNVDDCCEWAIAIREAIEVAAGRALQYEEASQADRNSRGRATH